MKDLTGRVAFITGAAGGIGLGIARVFTEHGVKVALADIDEAELEKSTADLAESGAEVVPVVLDVRTSRAIKGLPDTDVPPDDVTGQSATASMAPYEVGRRVVDAIVADELYVFTHPEYRNYIADHHERMMRGFDRAESFGK